MLLAPAYAKPAGRRKRLPADIPIDAPVPVIETIVRAHLPRAGRGDGDAYAMLRFVPEVPTNVRERVEQAFSVRYADHDEAYVVEAGEDTVTVYAGTERGLLYGACSILHALEAGELEQGLIYDYPVCSVRGLKVYLPAREDIPYFKQFIDMIVYYKYNTVMIEVGGAMEYRKHPEINEGWTDYCAEMSEYSGKTTVIQEHTFDWYKNSIHVENGGGGWLDQDTVRDLVAYCKERKLEVIPEVPSLSHCDYLLIRHPELRERQNDPYPDTYCPSNPASYELLFDVLEEVIDVFRPEKINIGHDEYYSIGICDRCRGRDAADIYAEDIRKIHAFLAERGVRTMIWGEKLLSIGGAAKDMYRAWDREHGDFLGTIPATSAAIDLVPKDLLILHWYWKHRDAELEYFERDFEVIYGNFAGSTFEDWETRIRRGARGGIISNWSALKEINLQRNGVLFEIAYSAHLFWNGRYTGDQGDEVMEEAFRELFAYRHRRLLRSDDSPQQKPAACAYIRVTHTTDCRIEYREFVDGVFIEQDRYDLGCYVLEYEDGDTARLPIVYGVNISNRDVDWSRGDRLLQEIASGALPTRIGGHAYYDCIYENPRPDRRPVGIRLELNKDKQCAIHIRNIAFV